MTIQNNRAKPVRILAVFLCLAMALYSGYWYWLAQSFEDVMHQWQANMARTSSSLTYDSLTVSGFPGTLSINVHNLDMHQSQRSKWHFPLFQIKINPLDMDTLQVIAPQTNRFQTLDKSFDLSMDFDSLLIEHGYNTKERTQHARLSVNNMAFVNTAEKAALDHLEIDLTITPPLYKPISSYAELKRWHDHNGTVQFNRMVLERGGIKIESDGALSLSATFQPRFNGTISVMGVIELLTQLQEEKIINEKMASLVKSFITMLNGGKKPQTNQPLVAPVTINETGMLMIGPFPILTIPPIDWNSL